MGTPADATGSKGAKTKEEALESCVDQHLALIACFKTCSLWSAFTGCCVAEHKTFWDCYTKERGTNATKISSLIGSKFSSPGAAQAGDSGQGSGSGAAAEAAAQPAQQREGAPQ